MAGFTLRQRTSGAAPTIKPVVAKDSETFTAGDMVNLEGGLADLAVTTDTNLLGTVLHTIVAVSGVTKLKVVTDDDAVYAVDDPNARVMGATLDLAGATGAQGVAASANKEFVVVADCSAAEETLVRINVGKHHNNKAL